MQTDRAPVHDLIVVGGGPAGTTLATLVARAGHRVLLLEAQSFPRYQIGESLLPATFNGMLPLLGIEVDPASLGQPVLKRGATFHWGRDNALWTLNFGGAPDDVVPAPGWPTAFNVRRDVFDAHLLSAARAAGVEIREGVRAIGFEADEERVHGVQVSEGGTTRTLHATWIAGATGQACPLAPLVGERQPSRFFRNAAVFSYFEGGRRLPSPLEGNVLLESFGDGWAWYIPLDAHLTSVGVVLHHPATERLRGDREAVYRECLSRCLYVNEYLQGATRVSEGQYAPLRMRSEFSYTHSRFWRPGALLVGDSACFVDVILSSGVHLAMFGALQAARAVNASLAGELPERLCMNEFELRYRLEFTRFYQGLLGLHDMSHDGATYRRWLRTMLQQTQGVFLDDEAEADPARRMRAWQAVNFLRRQNATLLASEAAPSLSETPVLQGMVGELTVGPDGLAFVRPSEPAVGTPVQAHPLPAPNVHSPLYDYGKLHAGHAPYLATSPDSIDAAQRLVRGARQRGLRLRVRGSGHTFSGASLPRAGEILVRTQGLDHFEFVAPDRLLAGSGALVWDIRDLARDHGYDLPVFNGGWAGPTLGGYISAGGFGKSGLSEQDGGLWENVHAIRLLDGTGELRRVTREDAVFRWLFGSAGQLGLIVDAELRLVPHAAAAAPPAYPQGLAGRIPRRQADDPAVNDLAPVAGEKRLFWFTVLVSPAREAIAWEGLEQLVAKHHDILVPDGGWAGPLRDGVPIGYRYVIRFHTFNPPLVYPVDETFLVLGVMSFLAGGEPARDARILALEADFTTMALSRGLGLYLQAENISGQVDLEAYYGAATWSRFQALRESFDPAGMFNPGGTFPGAGG